MNPARWEGGPQNPVNKYLFGLFLFLVGWDWWDIDFVFERKQNTVQKYNMIINLYIIQSNIVHCILCIVY